MSTHPTHIRLRAVRAARNRLRRRLAAQTTTASVRLLRATMQRAQQCSAIELRAHICERGARSSFSRIIKPMSLLHKLRLPTSSRKLRVASCNCFRLAARLSRSLERMRRGARANRALRWLRLRCHTSVSLACSLAACSHAHCSLCDRTSDALDELKWKRKFADESAYEFARAQSSSAPCE